MRSTPLPDLDELTPGARRILDVAGRLFYERGIAAVGVDTVAAESGVTKRTLYDRFGSKDALVTCYLLDRDRRWRTLVEGHLDRLDDPAERIVAPFDALDDWLGDSARGCAMVHALAELPDAEHPARQVALAEKVWLVDLFERLARDAGAGSRAGEVAGRLYCLHEGALAMQATAPDLPSAAIARGAARLVLEAALSEARDETAVRSR